MLGAFCLSFVALLFVCAFVADWLVYQERERERAHQRWMALNAPKKGKKS